MFQRVQLIGNVGRDPEMRYTPSGTAVTNFSMATSRYAGTKDEQPVYETTWWRVTVWGKTAEFANEKLHKGSKVMVEGHMIVDPATSGPRVYEKKDGTWAASFELNAENLRALDPKGSSRSEEADDAHTDPDWS